ncbi:MAG: hypothetical protein Kow006_13360 [Gammaproteobacteria bacterium]
MGRVWELSGVVSSGLGEGAQFTALPWAQREFETSLGFQPVPGTFNLSMTGSAWQACRERLRSAPGVAIEPPQGYCRAKCFAVLLCNRVTGALVRPEVPGYPEDKFEVLCPIAVRETLGLSDGERISVKLWFDWVQAQNDYRVIAAGSGRLTEVAP